MKTKAFSLLVLGLLSMQIANAQKFKITEGSLNDIVASKQLNVTYDYSDMRVGKFDNEADYISKKKNDYNNKEAGKGDEWEKSWVADRAGRFQPQFEELFNKYSDIKAGNDPSSAYTMIVKTTFTEPGFNVGVMRSNAYISGEILFVETANTGHVIATISFTKSPGRDFGGYDFDTGYRIQQAYAALGKGLAKFLKKQ